MQKHCRTLVLLAVLGLFSLFVTHAQPESGEPVSVSSDWLAQNLSLPEDCPAEPRGLLAHPEAVRLHVFPLGPNQQLLELTCDVFVYQASIAYFIAPAGVLKDSDNSLPAPLKPVSFRIAELPEEGEEPSVSDTSLLIGVPRFSRETGLLELLTLGRGLGDCGRFHKWRYDEEAGRFILQEARGRECSDSTTLFPPPEQWPLLFSGSPKSEDLSWVSVGSLKEPLDDVGCALTHRETVGNFPQIFKFSQNGAWMNLNDEERLLEKVSDDPDATEYRWGEVTIRIDYGEDTPHEGGMSYPEATITLVQDGHEATIPAKGGCAC